jgi:hypothetical protein
MLFRGSLVKAPSGCNLVPPPTLRLVKPTTPVAAKSRLPFAAMASESSLGRMHGLMSTNLERDLGPSSFTINRQGVPTTSFDVGLRTHTATFGVSYKFCGPGALLSAN